MSFVDQSTMDVCSEMEAEVTPKRIRQVLNSSHVPWDFIHETRNESNCEQRDASLNMFKSLPHHPRMFENL